MRAGELADFLQQLVKELVRGQGGVLVYVRDRASGKVAWSGLYTKDVHDTDKVTAETIQRGADELLRDLK